MSAIARRCVLFATVALLGLSPSGCIVTDWHWIWEDGNEQHCQKVHVNMHPPGEPGYSMSVAVPADN